MYSSQETTSTVEEILSITFSYISGDALKSPLTIVNHETKAPCLTCHVSIADIDLVIVPGILVQETDNNSKEILLWIPAVPPYSLALPGLI